MHQSNRTFIRRYFGWFAVYALAIAAYLWAAYAAGIPEAVRGTPADPSTFLTPRQLEQSGAYSALRNGIYFISYPWEWAIFLVLLLTGTARRWRDRWQAVKAPAALRFAGYVASLQLVSLLAFLPLRLLSYGLARGYGVSTQSVGSWLRDLTVSFAVNTLVLTVVAGAALYLIGKGGRWWLKLWALSVPFTLLMMFIQPIVIDPLYNTFSRLSDPVLEQRILDLAHRANIPADRVYEVNMSEKTNALNAYVNGIGGSLRIVLWDTTLQRLEPDEIMLIMAHEMGHYVMHHLEWSAFGAVASSLAMLWLGSVVYLRIVRRWGDRCGIRGPSDWAALPLLLLLISAASFASTPLSSGISRHAEHAADRYAYDLIGSTQGADTMYQKLAASSLSAVHPPPLVYWFRSTHPSTMERILDAESYRPRRP